MRPVCNNCDARLDDGLRGDSTICPKCGRTWTLSADRQSIAITLDVQSVTYRAANIIGGNDNG